MDDSTRLAFYAGAAGVALGAATVGLLTPDPVYLAYTGLNREYVHGSAKLWASIDVSEEGYSVEIAERKGGKVNDFPDFKSPFFPYPFAAAVFADDIAADLGYSPSEPWASDANKAATVRASERKKK
jgi:hypothetical protein